VTTPNFGALPKDQKPVNPYNDFNITGQNRRYTEYRRVKSNGSILYNYNNVNFYTGSVRLNQCDAYFASTNWGLRKTNAINTCKVQALVKMADAKVNLPVAYAEARKTSDMILDAANRIMKAGQALRRGRLGDLAKHLNITPKRAHKSWLEYKYGWMPLLMDVKGAAEFFAQQHVERAPRWVVTKRESLSQDYSKSVSIPTFGGGPNHDEYYSCSSKFDVRITYWCELSSPHLAAMQQLGMTNPALVAWELVPFSFVFDWFISVGDWLTALTAQQGVTIRRVLYSTADELKYENANPATTWSDATYEYYQSGGANATVVKRYVRGNSVPDGFTYPPMDVNFGFQKLVTSLALIRGAHRGGARP